MHDDQFDRDAEASARFIGYSLDPMTITQALGLPPDRVFRHGEAYRFASYSSGGRVNTQSAVVINAHRRAQFGFWSMSSRHWVDSTSLPPHIEWLLDQLEPRAEVVRQLARAGVSCDIVCFSLSPWKNPPPLPLRLQERADRISMRFDVHQYDSRW